MLISNSRASSAGLFGPLLPQEIASQPQLVERVRQQMAEEFIAEWQSHVAQVRWQ